MPPKGECGTGDKLTLVRFRLKLCSCLESSNAQMGFIFGCTDTAPLPSSGSEPVRITCLDSADNSLLFSDTVEEGDNLDMSVPDGDESLPEQVRCSIFNLMGDLLQSLVINMSGQDDLYLKDKYGSLTLEACNSQVCNTDVTYAYTVENTGSKLMTVTEFARMRNGVREDLLPAEVPFDLAPGDSRTSTEIETVDLCVGKFHQKFNLKVVYYAPKHCRYNRNRRRILHRRRSGRRPFRRERVSQRSRLLFPDLGRVLG